MEYFKAPEVRFMKFELLDHSNELYIVILEKLVSGPAYMLCLCRHSEVPTFRNGSHMLRQRVHYLRIF